MAEPTLRERVAVVETKVDALTETVEKGFEATQNAIAAQSLNGRTARVKEMVDRIGDPDSILALRSIILSHDRARWATRPLAALVRLVAAAALGAAAGALASRLIY